MFDGKCYKNIPARDLWNKIMQSTYDFADPGVIFIDRVNKANPLSQLEHISCSNPCGEQMLPPHGICCLGSINLTRFVHNPFTHQASFAMERMQDIVPVAVRMLDNVLSVTSYPLEQQRAEALAKRRIGLGITGLADALVMLGIKYSSEKAAKFADTVTARIREAAEHATESLGREKGSFPLFNPDHYTGGKFRRNSHVMSIQPTGTVSLFAGNVSSGIEPIFDLSYTRKILQKDNSWKEVEIKDYAWGEFHDLSFTQGRDDQFLNDSSRSVWETTAKLSPKDHLAVLAACQSNVDSSVSKTINCPEDISFDAFKDIYLEAYQLGVKCCTTYRPNKVTGSILSSSDMTVKGEGDVSNVVELTKPLVRPQKLIGLTYRLKPAGLDHALFITVNDIEVGGVWRPYEVFINTKNLEFAVWTTALTRMISAVFRKGGDIAFVVEELKVVFDPRGGYWEGTSFIPSIIAGIGNVIGQHLESLGISSAPEGSETSKAKKHCPKCQTGALSNASGCWSCNSCTYSTCG